ncbi:very-long-chain (3R)-3-hydroxyacyl-CoA dehydratase 1 isoform X1 [Rhincodon typus]|uniref:very-long-chain (3R)-3-hydroxyacyl-CoA dehydratase 1 isoform X1 n=1 Tax=Rhincodon typus TaxID=259920 RepID=UPI00202F212E|nr:very-long-chain (3R)-3-hydroxyacyl-CoA dehydratase 1 isoform X1 [Rhincodon typus]
MAPSEEDGSMEEKETKKKPLSPFATAWLTFYNITMTAGWLVLVVAMIRFSYQKRTHKGLYRSIQKTLKFFQTFALLEIIHCAVGIVRTSVLVTGVQVMSRIFMVWFVIHSIRPVIDVTGHASIYCQSLIAQRYNFFIILYPIGVVGELLTIYGALPFVKKSGMYSLRLPNKFNVSFDYYTCLIIVMIAYIPLFPQLYFHMLRQRRKVLHGEVIKEKED